MRSNRVKQKSTRPKRIKVLTKENKKHDIEIQADILQKHPRIKIQLGLLRPLKEFSFIE